MRKILNFCILFFFLTLIIASSCKKEQPEDILNEFKNIEDVVLHLNFGTSKANKTDYELTKQTPDNYFVALKRVTIIGNNETSDFEVFNKSNLASSLVFDFTDTQTTHSLMQGVNVPDGEYSSVKLEIYYLQMKLDIATSSSIEKRNIRIYLSDDAETEGGFHQPGDMTQVTNSNIEEGWLLGNGLSPDMTPVSPRSAAYTEDEGDDGLGDGNIWFDFAGKPANNFGPFGDIDFMNNSPHPIYYTTLNFSLTDNGGNNIVIDFNVHECWQFEDKDSNGAFGAGDLIEDPNPTRWHMALPEMSVTLQ